MANPRKFSEKIALHNQKQAEETAAFEKIMQEVSAATNKPEETSLAAQYGMSGGRSGGTSPSRSSGQRGRSASSVGPMRRPAERKHDTSPYGSTAYLSPPPDSSWRRTNSDSALHQTCGEQQSGPSLSPHHPLHSHAHPHHPQHQNHRRADIHLDALSTMGGNMNNRPRSSCEIPRIPNNTNMYGAGGGGGVGGAGGGGGSLTCGELQVPGGSLPDLTSMHYPPMHPAYSRVTDYQHPSPTSCGAVSPGAGSVSPATGGLSPASGSPVGATVPSVPSVAALDALHSIPLRHDNGTGLYENHLSVPNTNNYLHQNKNMSPLDHSWMTTSYQSPCSPPSQYSSTSNINIPSPTMAHSPGSPVESPQADYIQTSLLQPFESFTMMDNPATNYNTSYINHSSPHSPQTTNSPHTYSQSPHRSSPGLSCSGGGRSPSECRSSPRQERDPVPGGNGPVFPAVLPQYASPDTPIPDIILTDYSSEQLRADLDLDDLSLLDEPSSLLPDSAVEHEFRLDRL